MLVQHMEFNILRRESLIHMNALLISHVPLLAKSAAFAVGSHIAKSRLPHTPSLSLKPWRGDCER